MDDDLLNQFRRALYAIATGDSTETDQVAIKNFVDREREIRKQIATEALNPGSNLISLRAYRMRKKARGY